MRASGHNGRRAAHGYGPTREPLYISGSRVGKRADTSALVCYFDDTTPIGRSPEPGPPGLISGNWTSRYADQALSNRRAVARKGE